MRGHAGETAYASYPSRHVQRVPTRATHGAFWCHVFDACCLPVPGPQVRSDVVSRVERSGRRSHSEDLERIEISLLVSADALTSLVGIASVRRWNAHLCAPKSHSQDRVDFDEI